MQNVDVEEVRLLLMDSWWNAFRSHDLIARAALAHYEIDDAGMMREVVDIIRRFESPMDSFEMAERVAEIIEAELSSRQRFLASIPDAAMTEKQLSEFAAREGEA